jgi:AraC family transcriptional regulator
VSVQAERMPDLSRMLALVERSLDRPDEDGAALAAAAHLSRFHFDRLVSAALGEPPGAFRRRLLLERAAIQLARTDDPVIDVATVAGYGSPDAFTRAFSRAFGSTPSDYRSAREHVWWLSCPSGIHVHPPGGLRLPSTARTTAMDTLVRLYDHHLDTTSAVLERLDRVPDALDRPIELSVEGIDRDVTLRTLADRLVRQLEMWITAIDGGTSVPAGRTDPAGLRDRLASAGPRFRVLVVDRVSAGDGEETFLDATCDPPAAFTLAGVLAHVLTFAAVRRTLAIGALETAGVTDLGSGDPMQYVGGAGEDASRIRRSFELRDGGTPHS